MKNKKNNITSELSKENKILIILTLLAAVISITTGIVDLILGLESIMLWISFFSFTIVFLLMFTIAFRVIAGYTRTLQELEQVKHELQDINEKLVVVSETDELTGLCNRRHIMSLLKRLILLKEEEGFSLVMLDIDYFQAINNTHGHSVGDSVIKSVAKKLERNTRRSDTIGRIAVKNF